MIWETVRLSLRSIRRNILRSFLTLLGIVIGVAAVIAMLTIGSGTTEKVKADISKLGSNLLVVRAGRPAGPGGPGGLDQAARPLAEKDVTALVAHLNG
ncbi:ABC transporter permease, partial [Mesorhizobium sp. M00.F.Ca.ET.149.01.1.1]